ncbi:MAG: DUF4197 domain-containing protein [Ferruginibacter sp.]
MKKVFITLLVANIFFVSAYAQGLQGLLNKAKSAIPGSSNNAGSNLSNGDIISGLKEALKVGTDSTTKKLGAVDGFYGNAAIKILMPPEAQKVEKTLRSFGMGSLVDKAILSMNRAAEDASSNVGSIFWDAITNMSVGDGLTILRGSDTAATGYLRQNTTTQLTAKFRPIIDNSLNKYNATQYWNDVFSAYNKFSSQKVNTDLIGYVTDRALNGLFYNIGLEEQKIRKDPAAQVTDILKKVFGGK